MSLRTHAHATAHARAPATLAVASTPLALTHVTQVTHIAIAHALSPPLTRRARRTCTSPTPTASRSAMPSSGGRHRWARGPRTSPRRSCRSTRCPRRCSAATSSTRSSARCGRATAPIAHAHHHHHRHRPRTLQHQSSPSLCQNLPTLMPTDALLPCHPLISITPSPYRRAIAGA